MAHRIGWNMHPRMVLHASPGISGGIICGVDILRFTHNTIGHLLTCVKHVGLSARYFSLIFSQIKLQYNNNATHPEYYLNTKQKDPQERA